MSIALDLANIRSDRQLTPPFGLLHQGGHGPVPRLSAFIRGSLRRGKRSRNQLRNWPRISADSFPSGRQPSARSIPFRPLCVTARFPRGGTGLAPCLSAAGGFEIQGGNRRSNQTGCESGPTPSPQPAAPLVRIVSRHTP